MRRIIVWIVIATVALGLSTARIEVVSAQSPAPVPVAASGTVYTPWYGEISFVAMTYCPLHSTPTDGRLLPIDQNQVLFSLFGVTYGGDGKTNFALPNLEMLTTESGAALLTCIELEGSYPWTDSKSSLRQQYMGQVYFSATKSCLPYTSPADGRLLPIDQYQPLFSLLGTTYGGDGKTNFALPNLENLTTKTPGTTLMACIAVRGDDLRQGAIAHEFIGTVVFLSTNSCPGDMLPADGRLLPIGQYTNLFSLFGTTYGGDGKTNFALPNLEKLRTKMLGSTVAACVANAGLYPPRS